MVISMFFKHINVTVYIYEHSSSTKLMLNESTKRNAWLSLRATSPWRATNSEEFNVVWHDRYFFFLHASPLNFCNHGAP